MAPEAEVKWVPNDLGLSPEWQKKLDEVRAAWGIAEDRAGDLAKKLERLLASTAGQPAADDLTALVRGFLSADSIDFALLRSFGELKDLTKTWTSHVKKNRSALA